MPARVSPAASRRSCLPRSSCVAQGFCDELRAVVALRRRARRARGARAVPARRADLDQHRRALSAGDDARQPLRRARARRARRARPERRRLPPRRHGGDRLLHDVLDVDARVPSPRRGWAALAAERKRRAEPAAGRRRSRARTAARGRLVIEDGLRLSVYFGERDRAGGGLLADALIDAFAAHGVKTSVLLRGLEGFGLKHRLQSERLLTLSEDLPMLALAVDTQARVEALLADVRAISGEGLITL